MYVYRGIFFYFFFFVYEFGIVNTGVTNLSRWNAAGKKGLSSEAARRHTEERPSRLLYGHVAVLRRWRRTRRTRRRRRRKSRKRRWCGGGDGKRWNGLHARARTPISLHHRLFYRPHSRRLPPISFRGSLAEKTPSEREESEPCSRLMTISLL